MKRNPCPLNFAFIFPFPLVNPLPKIYFDYVDIFLFYVSFYFILTYQPIPFYLVAFLAAGCSGTWRVLRNLFPVPCSPIFLIFLIKKKKISSSDTTEIQNREDREI